MAAADVQAPPAEPTPGVPDYVLDPNAVLKDTIGSWRYGKAPDYSKTRSYWEATKSKDHVTGSLESIAENLVKNWEVEASFKTDLADWRTIDRENYSFAMNGGPAQTGEHMLKVGTYNAIIAPNEYYSPATSDFSSSHKTFKRMMPTFAWEVLEVYSGPPRVAFRWRHWGVMKNDYVGFNDKGEKITAKSHGGTIDVQGVTVALIDDKLRVQKLETWFDSMDMFRQIAPNGIVNKQAVGHKTGGDTPQSDSEDSHTDDVTYDKPAADTNALPVRTSGVAAETTASTPSKSRTAPSEPSKPDLSVAGGIPESDPADERAASANPLAPDTTTTEAPPTIINPSETSAYTTAVTGNVEAKAPVATPAEAASTPDKWDELLDKPAEQVHPFPNDVEKSVQPEAGDAVAAPADSDEARATYEEMSRVTPLQCPFMNKE